MIRLGKFPNFFGLVQHDLRLLRGRLAAEITRPQNAKNGIHARHCVHVYIHTAGRMQTLSLRLAAVHSPLRHAQPLQADGQACGRARAATDACMHALREWGARNSCY